MIGTGNKNRTAPFLARVAKLSSIWWVLWGLCFSTPVAAQSYNFQVYGNDAGLPQAQVTAVFQSKNGYIWVGTLSGAARYNGRSWRVFTKQDGLARNHITAIGQFDDGRMVFGSSGGGLTLFDGTKFHKYPQDHFLSSGTVTALWVKGNEAWVGTQQGLAHIKGDEVTVYEAMDGLPSSHVTALYMRSNDTLVIGTDKGVTAYNDNDKAFTKLEASVSSHIGVVQGIIETAEEQLFLATTSGLYVERGPRIGLYNHEGVTFPYQFTSAAVDRYGTLWFGTSAFGVVRLKGGKPSILTTQNGLSNDNVLCIMADRENNIWFGTDFGLSKLLEGPFLSYTTNQGLVHDMVRCLYQDSQDTLWIGTREGISSWSEEQFDNPIPTQNLPDEKVYSIAEHPDGGIIFASLHGITLYRDGKTRNFTRANGLPVSHLRKVFVDSQQRIWIAGDGVCEWKGDTFFVFPENHLLNNTKVIDIEEDRRGALWFATRDHGLVGLDAHDELILDYQQRFDASLWDLATDREGLLWIGTNGLGAFHMNTDGSLMQYTTEDGLKDMYIWQVLCTSDGDVWFGHNKGLDRFSNGRFSNFTESEGVSHNESSATAAIEAHDRSLWFGTAKGLTRFIPSKVSTLDLPPLVQIEEIIVNDRLRLDPDQTTELKPSQNSIQFRFSGLSFRNEASIQYQFMLENLDPDWRAITRDNDFNYANLGKGTYRFLVRATNQSGEWSAEPAAFEFTIQPAFYETWWFLALMFVAAILLIAGIIRLQIYRYKQQKIRLEKLVEERTSELEIKTLELEQTNSQLRSLSISDSLTKLKNRRYLSEIMPGEVKVLYRRHRDAKQGLYRRSARNNLGILMADMDYFKSVNDTYGHDAGDMVLRKLASIFSEQVRASDVVARWGGEEFLILLKEVKPGALGLAANKMLERIRNTDFDIGDGRVIQRTCSVGFAYIPGHFNPETLTWEDVVKVADTALYIAKRNGRDQACGLLYNEDFSQEDIADAVKKDISAGIDKGIFVLVQAGEDGKPVRMLRATS